MIHHILTSLVLDEVILIPNYIGPNKPTPLFKSYERIQMINLLIKNELSTQFENHKFKCSDIEIKQKKSCFTIDTIDQLKKRAPQDNFCLLIGSDNFFSFHQWKSYKDLIKQVTICVVKRDNETLEKYQDYAETYFKDQGNQGVFILNNQPLSVASSEIRKKILERESVLELLPESIYLYIKGKK